MIEQLWDKDIAILQSEGKRDNQRTAHADAVAESHEKAGGQEDNGEGVNQ